MGLFDNDLATYALYAGVLALIGFLIWFLVFRKPGGAKKDKYEEEDYEEDAGEGYEEDGEGYEEDGEGYEDDDEAYEEEESGEGYEEEESGEGYQDDDE